MQPSFLPYVLANKVTVLGHGALPEPIAVGFDDLLRTGVNCRLVRVRGVVRAADLQFSAIDPNGHLQLLMEGGYVDLRWTARMRARSKACSTRRWKSME